MQRMLMDMESYGVTDIGSRRQNNEDVWAELPDCQFYILADGLGGHQGGEVAAKEAVMGLCDAIDTLFLSDEKPTAAKASHAIESGVKHVNKAIRGLALQHQELAGMGTTMCCFLILENTLIYAHIGDSRVYRFRGKLERLTQDHSLRQKLLSSGDLDETSASKFPYKNIVTRAIGTTPTVSAEIKTSPIHKGDIYFLCSDGLTDSLSDLQIEEILKNSSSIKEASLDLVEAAKAAGSSDNITIVMVKTSA
ncbi:MAG: Stp1/IreP family PP2C-type Ser/Thr phosphatase [Verrucomicrobia bacterium]|nr:Stp1/IreP family PP2C-type Ser/Thr phosphatase [Verrucomicrobiota bacterium]